MNDAWYYRDGELQYGPMALVDLQRAIREGRASPTVLVSSPATQGQWLPAAQALASNVVGLTNDAGLEYIIPTAQTSRVSLIAGYLGIVSLVICPLAPAALVVGILGVRDLRANREKNGWGRAITAIVIGSLGTIGMIVWLIFVVLKPR